MLADRLRSLRTSKTNFTQAEFAKKIEVARTTYAMYEQGNREPDYKTLKKIADFYDVSSDYLLGRSASEEKKTDEHKDDLRDPQTNLLFDGWLEMDDDQRKEALDFMEYLRSKKEKKGK
ncbi:transcriptional regulator [Sporosarcina sp. NCCP-2716]|uniref:helix-turn-helix domain-containing protein n=1 Tax=Sporosarcina sp. NCCP-2716 TaxID=2943679 RepID=UPI00203F8983|nr:helix-turn-helix domain-containing protein [Sporosarcina sp. NCCP-2716]GKV70231.1 transcriptional regulator [Sporosarcina sp. NCCP-2716]